MIDAPLILGIPIPIVWCGWGWIVPVIVIAVMFMCTSISEDYGLPIGAIVSGVILWFVGKLINDPVDESYQADHSWFSDYYHTFFWIRIEWWGVIVFVLGAGLLALMLSNRN